MPITTTLNKIRACGPCGLDPKADPLTGYQKLVAHLGSGYGLDEPVPFSAIVESNGIEDALWCCCAEPQHDKTWRLFAVWCARQVEHLLTDERPRHAINVAERHANGMATDEELEAAWEAARAAARAAWEAAGDAAWEAARDAQTAKFLEMVA